MLEESEVSQGIALKSYTDRANSTVTVWIKYDSTGMLKDDAQAEAIRQLREQGVLDDTVETVTWHAPREIPSDISWNSNGACPKIKEMKGTFKLPTTEPVEPANDGASMFRGWSDVIWTATR